MSTSIKKRYSEYDFAKVVATILIVFHHYQQLFPIRYKGINFFGGKFFFGYLVEMFFIISGIFAYKWIKNIYNGKTDFIHFYLKRIIRLLPLVTICILTDVALRIVYYYSYGNWNHGKKPSIISTLASCLGISDGWFFDNPIKTPLWYISVLLWCYIVFYCIVYITKKIFKKQLFIFLLSFFVILVGVVIVSLHLDLPFLNDDMSRGYLAFFAGVIFAELLNRIDVTKLFYQIIALFFICLYCILKATGLNIPVESYVVIFILWPSVLVLLKSSILVSIYNTKALEYLADCSFDAYVWHMTILEVLLVMFKKFGVSILNSFIGMIISLIIISVIAIISNKFINKPISKKLQSLLFEK